MQATYLSLEWTEVKMRDVFGIQPSPVPCVMFHSYQDSSFGGLLPCDISSNFFGSSHAFAAFLLGFASE